MIQIGVVGSVVVVNSYIIEILNIFKFVFRVKNNIVSYVKKVEEVLGVGGDGGVRVFFECYCMEIFEFWN